MTTDTTYNGWTNYATWLVNLWLDNDAGNSIHEEAIRFVQDAIDDGNPLEDARNIATSDLADYLRGLHDDGAADLGLGGAIGVFADLINAALRAVNWREIAEHYIGDVDVNELTIEDEEATE